jgi:tetraprenyl-beta-curcumene synthase
LRAPSAESGSTISAEQATFRRRGIRRTTGPGDWAAFGATLTRYALAVRPCAGRELQRLRLRAERIPDRQLRALASFVLGEESWTVEGAAFFATLAPSEHLGPAVRLMVAFQTMFNFLDAIDEQPEPSRCRDDMQLYEALLDALDPAAPGAGYYLHLAPLEDGGFLESLVAECRAALAELPSGAEILPVARRVATRCGESQAHVHAGIHGHSSEIASWGLRQDVEGCEWWETAAGAISSLSLHALFAAAADPATTGEDAARVDAAYFPSLCTLATLLDSLIDQDHDLSTGSFNAVSRYESRSAAARRLESLAEEADRGVRSLRHGRRHAVILCAIAAAYLSAPEMEDPRARQATAGVAGALGPMASLARLLMRWRRGIGTGLADAGARQGPLDGVADAR